MLDRRCTVELAADSLDAALRTAFAGIGVARPGRCDLPATVAPCVPACRVPLLRTLPLTCYTAASRVEFEEGKWGIMSGKL